MYKKLRYIISSYTGSNCAILLTIIGLSLVLRLAIWLCDPILMRDSILYLHMAEVWHACGSYQEMIDIVGTNWVWVPPLHIYLIQLAMYLELTAESAARILSLLFGLTIPVIGYLIAKTISPQRRIAIFSAIFLAVNPVLVEYSTQPTRDVFYLSCAGLLLYYILRSIRDHRTFDWIVAGGLCAVSCTIRYESFEFVLYVIIYFLVATLCLRQYSYKIGIACCCGFMLSFMILLITLHLCMGSMFNVSDGYIVYYERSSNIDIIRNTVRLFE